MKKTSKIFNIYRLPDWWNFIFPQILGFAYLQFFLDEQLLKDVYKDLFFFFVSFIGTASYGFFLNDITDINEDRFAGKKNFAAEISVFLRIVLLVISLCIAVIPWFFIRFNPTAFGLFLGQVLILFLYSTPPIRLKKNKFTGLFSDALYSSVLPAFIALFLFSKNENYFYSFWCFLVVVFAAMFLLGVRSHLMHQVRDYEHDLRINAKNFVISFGIQKSVRFIYKIIIPLELLIAILFWFLILCEKILLWYQYLIFGVLLVLYGLAVKRFSNKDGYWFNFLNDIYGDFLPIFSLILLSIFSKYYLALFVIHFFFFRRKPIYLFVKHLLIHYIYHGCVVWLYYKMFCNRYIKRFYSFVKKNLFIRL